MAHQSGILYRLYHQNKIGSKTEEITEELIGFSLSFVVFQFSILLSGIILSIFILFLEIIYYNFSNKFKRKILNRKK